MPRSKSSKNILFRALVFFFLVGNSLGVMAEEFIIGTDPWPPFTIVDSGTFSGIDIDIAKEIEKRLPDVTFTFREIPWIRALHYMETGEIDIITGLAKREDREKYILYTSPPYYSKCSTRFYVKKGSSITIRKYDDLYRFKVGYVANSAYFNKFDTDEKLKKHSVTHEKQLLDMLISDRFDVIIGTNCQVDYHISLQGLQGEIEEVEYGPNNSVDLYFGLSKKSRITELLPELNKIIHELKEKGIIQQIADKYFN